MNTNKPNNKQPDVDIDQLLTGLARAARSETAPKVDVTRAVLQRLEEEEPAVYTLSEKVWWYATAGSLVAAGIAMMISYQSWIELTDPAYEVLTSMQVALR
ncbi:MAG: hypothetical protein CMJ46_07590 [Planctomyces sp.]|nr:hypothetical protein [Planctomyces sp.]